jgi:pilus assembly protein Flp/PilA
MESYLLSDDEGASLVEYALLLALIALVAIAAVSVVGDNVSQDFQDIADSL